MGALWAKLWHCILGALLLVMALVQLNDPDPWLWSIFYCAASLAVFAALIGRSSIYYNWGIVAYALFLLSLSAPGTLEYIAHIGSDNLLTGMSPAKPYIEQAREFFGTLIALAIIAAYQYQCYRRQSGPV